MHDRGAAGRAGAGFAAATAEIGVADELLPNAEQKTSATTRSGWAAADPLSLLPSTGRQLKPQHTHTPRCRPPDTVLVGPDSFQDYYRICNHCDECVMNEALLANLLSISQLET